MRILIKLTVHFITRFFTSLFVISLVFDQTAFSQTDFFSVKAGTTAYNQFRLNESRTIFENIAHSNASVICDRVEAIQNLGWQDWKIFRNYDQSEKQLLSGLTYDCQKSKTFLLLGQLNFEAGNFSRATSFADKALLMGNLETDRMNALLLKSQIIYKENFNRLEMSMVTNTEDLLIASSALKEILEKQPGRPAPAECLLGISLLLKNGPDALDAWRSYYFITSDSHINRTILSSYNTFHSILPKWRERELSGTERVGLAKALAESAFYDYASMLINEKGKDNIMDSPGMKQIVDFNYYIRTVEKVNDSLYPRIALGLKNYDTAYTKAMESAARRLWISLDKSNHSSNYNEDDFFNQIESKYGAEGYLGTTVGYFSLLLGLKVHDEIKEINQYGLKADFRYISISRLISRDFTSWYGATNVGGWGTDSCIYQIRDAYLLEPFTRLNWVTDSTAYKQVSLQIAELKERDGVNCRKDKYAEPAFLSFSIKLKESKHLYDSLQKTGVKSNALNLAFISETMRLNVESTVFAHEGRHAIDQLYFKKEFDSMPQDERELRAKYSEVVYSSNPKLALTGSIFGGDLDSTTIHGKANFRMRKIIADWMQLHRDQIIGLDSSTPLLMQLDLLTNEQLREICISADPLAMHG